MHSLLCDIMEKYAIKHLLYTRSSYCGMFHQKPAVKLHSSQTLTSLLIFHVGLNVFFFFFWFFLSLWTWSSGTKCQLVLWGSNSLTFLHICKNVLCCFSTKYGSSPPSPPTVCLSLLLFMCDYSRVYCSLRSVSK